MTTITKLKNALESMQALQDPEGHIFHGFNPTKCTGECADIQKAITDLRSVIAEMEAGEPVEIRYRKHYPSGPHDGNRRVSDWMHMPYGARDLKDCATSLAAADCVEYLYTHPQPKAEPAVWYEGAPPFPQDQEWFIAETTFGDRVVLRSLDEGRMHHGNYAFKTADGTYMKEEIVKRWMQFPDCEYLPPSAQPKAAPKAKPLTDEQIDAVTDVQWAANNNKPVYAAHRAFARAIEAAHGIKP